MKKTRTDFRRVLFVTGTRADFGKITTLIEGLEASASFEPHLFVTGMHVLEEFGETWREIVSSHKCEMRMFSNHRRGDTLDSTLAKTVTALSDYVEDVVPDLIVVHGDRVEALAGALVGSLRGIMTAHLEGGESSGTIDDSIRHAITKLAHVHFTTNSIASQRVIELGENSRAVFEIGSADVDVLLSGELPSLEEISQRYELPKGKFAITIFHPVFFEQESIQQQSEQLVKFMKAMTLNFVVILPNNDPGYEKIVRAYEELAGIERIKLLPSMRLRHFLGLMGNAEFMLGNSSAAIYEASYLGLPAINVGSRQANRVRGSNVIDCEPDFDKLLQVVEAINTLPLLKRGSHGSGNAKSLFMQVLADEAFWELPLDKSALK